MDTTAPSHPRALSLAELIVGAAIVIGHNVYHVVPNEVPILFVLGIVSIRLREGSFAAIGLNRPKSWFRTIGYGAITAIVVIAVGQLVTEPLAQFIGLHQNKGLKDTLGPLAGHPWNVAKGLLIVWAFAAFGEEISYRRYLLGRAADVGRGTTLSYWIGLVVVSVLFGFGHYYQGPAGMFTTACDGFMIGAAYLLTGRNLWVPVIAHGLIDTIGIVLVTFGVAD